MTYILLEAWVKTEENEADQSKILKRNVPTCKLYQYYSYVS